MTSQVLLMIDAQRNMLEPPTPVPNAPAVGAAIAGVLESARDAGVTVIHVRNNGVVGDPDEPGTDGWQLVHPVRDGEAVVDKTTSDPFANTDLADLVPDGARIVVVGMQSEYCVRATSLAALARRHPVTMVTGAHATYDDDKPAADISKDVEDQLRAAGATIGSIDDKLF
ncbi:MAG TPA: isochorismatase family protein [Micromonosporaceae bacterium]|nr:isochorismatase family protein [Micromonosporaceae bacterium]